MSEEYQPLPQVYPTLTLGNGIKVPVKELLEIDGENLIPCYTNQSAWMGVIGFELASVTAMIDKLERDIKRMESRYTLEYRDILTNGKKAQPEWFVKAKIAASPDVQEKQDELAKFESHRAKVQAFRNALLGRGDMLVNMGADLRLSNRAINSSLI